MAPTGRRIHRQRDGAGEGAEQLAEVAARLYRLLRTALDDDPAAPSLEQFRILTRIDAGLHYVSSLAAVRQMRMSAITSLLDVTAERGWVIRRPDNVDRRRTRVDLTDSGRAAFELGRELTTARMGAILAAASLDADLLLVTIEALRDGVDRYDAERLTRDASTPVG